MDKSITRYRLLQNYWLLSIVGGVVIAQVAVVILHLSYLWAALAAIGLAVCLLSVIAKDAKRYWLAVFALALPLEIKKVLIDSESVRALADTYGIPLGELPAPVVYLSDLPFLVLMLYWISELLLEKRRIYFPRSHWMALSFIGWAALSLSNATVLSYSVYDLLRLAKFYLIYLYIANNVHTRESIKTLIKFLLVGVVFQAAVCLYQYFSQNISYVFGNTFGQQDLYSEESVEKFEAYYNVSGVEGDGVKRASGTVGPNNAQAQYFELLLPFALAIFLTAGRWSRRIPIFAIVMLGVSGLVVTFSRGGLIGLAVGTGSVVVIAMMARLMSFRKFMAIVLVGLIVTIMVLPAYHGYFTKRPEAFQARWYLMKVGLEIVKSHPLRGVGLNNHLVLKPEYDPRTYIFPMPVHNRYLLIATEIGIPGLIFYLAFLLATLRLAWRALRSDDSYMATVAVGVIAAILAISTHVLVDNMYNHTTLTLLWLIAGLAAAISRATQEQQKKTVHATNGDVF
jgi:hypothetical protein